MAESATVGVDLGGTNIKVGVVTAAGELAVREDIPTQAPHGPDHVIERIAGLIKKTVARWSPERDGICGVGIGSPGPLSCHDGIIYEAANLPGWKNYPIRDRLSEATGLPVVLENDANAAAYGEFIAGAGKGTRHMVLLTLGTGVGGGVIVDGKVLHGHFENAAEIGHMIVVPNGRPCPCGQTGCLERYASANAVVERYLETVRHAGASGLLSERIHSGQPITSADIATAARARDPLAAQIWDETCRFLAIGCVNLQHLFNPERIVIGGGLSSAAEQLLDPLRAHFEKLFWLLAHDRPSIEAARLGNDAGIIGAAALARQAFASPANDQSAA